MIKATKKNGFTLIELLFVIVVMGIVGGFALEAVRQFYEGIYKMGEYDKRVADADHILEQVAKYFENGISSSIVNLDQENNATGCYGPPDAGDTHDYTIAFLAVDSDSLQGISGNRPGWSEEVRLMSNNEINASDANYTMANSIITAFGSTLRNSAIYDSDSADVNACRRFNWDDTNLAPIAGYHKLDNSANPLTSTTIRLNNDNNATDGKRKYLLRTAYAFKVENDGNFTMYSNFRPWLNERYTTALNKSLLGQNVAHFYMDYNAQDFQANPDLNDRGLVWRLKVCMKGVDSNLSMSETDANDICRERRVHVRY